MTSFIYALGISTDMAEDERHVRDFGSFIVHLIDVIV
jgi:hypothetical protein